MVERCDKTILLQIGGLGFEISGPPGLLQLPAFQPFRTNQNQKEVIRCRIEVCERLPRLPAEALCGALPGCLVYRMRNREYRLFGKGLSRKTGAVECAGACLELDAGSGLLAKKEEIEERLWITRDVMQLNLASVMGFERLILPYDRLILHSSCVADRERGILFSAPSGTGKTTQARLWNRYAGAQILNEDRTVLHIPAAGGQIMAYGSPYTGSSKLVSTGHVPLNMVILLEQGEETTLRTVSKREAFSRLYRELTVNMWELLCVRTAGNLLEQLIERIPVYCLKCRADETAVQAVRNLLDCRGFRNRLSNGLMV